MASVRSAELSSKAWLSSGLSTASGSIVSLTTATTAATSAAARVCLTRDTDLDGASEGFEDRHAVRNMHWRAYGDAEKYAEPCGGTTAAEGCGPSCTGRI